jgi:hypothetical protein
MDITRLTMVFEIFDEDVEALKSFGIAANRAG